MNHADLDELILRLIAGVDLFRHLERQALADLLRGAAKAAFKAGEIVFEEGADGRSLYVVVRGSFEVYRMSGGKRLRLAEISTGEHFGEIALLGSHQRTASVAALEDSLALRLTQPLLDAQPAAAMLLYRNMASMLADRLLTADEEIVFHRSAHLTASAAGEPAASPVPPPSAAAD
jgi:CRP-like cAMP-binding protein